MGIGAGTEHARDHELRMRIALAQHGHERDGSIHIEEYRGLAEVGLRRLVHRLQQLAFGGGGVPAGDRRLDLETYARAIWRIGLERLLYPLSRATSIHRRRQAQGELGGGKRP